MKDIIEIVFYLIMIAFAVYSILALYALLSFGKSKTLSFAIAVLYLIISAGLFAATLNNLNNL